MRYSNSERLYRFAAYVLGCRTPTLMVDIARATGYGKMQTNRNVRALARFFPISICKAGERRRSAPNSLVVCVDGDELLARVLELEQQRACFVKLAHDY